jgi:hypothetical protein
MVAVGLSVRYWGFKRGFAGIMLSYTLYKVINLTAKNFL